MMRDNNNRHTRRKFLITTGAAAGTGLAGCTGEEDGEANGGNGSDGEQSDDEDIDFPEQDIQLIVPFGPGGGYDTYSRLLAPYLGEELGVDVNVQNVEGAGGSVGTEQVYNSDPDGYTLQIVNSDNQTLSQIQQDVNYDVGEMTWFGQVAQSIKALGVRPDLGIDDFDSFIEAVQNEELRFYASGPGTPSVLATALMGEWSGLYDPRNVADNTVIYGGRGEAIQGMISGDVDAMTGTYGSLLAYEDEMDIIFIFDNEDPSPLNPDLDTAAGQPDLEDSVDQLYALMTDFRIFGGPPDIPSDRVNILRDAFEAAITSDDFVEEAEEADRPVSYADGEEVEQIVNDLYDTWVERQDLLEDGF